MDIFYTVMTLVRPVILIVAVIGFTVLMLKIARSNSKRKTEAINQLIDLVANMSSDETTSDEAMSGETASYDNPAASNEGRPEFIRPKELNIEELVIPEDFMFKEEFEILKYMAMKYPDYYQITLYEPVSITTVSLFEQRIGIKFTDELKALYTFTNGMDLSMCTLGFDFLEAIENMYNTGYCDFEKEGDANDYVIVGDYLGCGDPIVLEKSTGNLYTVDHEIGEKSEPWKLKELLYWAIEITASDLGPDKRIEDYLSNNG